MANRIGPELSSKIEDETRLIEFAISIYLCGFIDCETLPVAVVAAELRKVHS